MSSLAKDGDGAPSQAESEVTPRSTDRSDRVREMAYFLWLEAGSPEGEADRHWSAAEATHDSEASEREASERKRIEGEPPGEPVTKASTSTRAPRTAAE
jgi:Protein of unknown function (DUF2934)